jgi:hypothetical protein
LNTAWPTTRSRTGATASLTWTVADGTVQSPNYSAGYLGLSVAILSCIILTLGGFYLIAGSVRRDRQRGVGETEECFGGLQAFLIDVAHRSLSDVGLLGILLLAANMGHPLPAHANVGNHNPVIGADDPARGRRLVLAVDRGLDQVGRGNGRRHCSGLFEERPACLSTGPGLDLICAHKSFGWFFSYRRYPKLAEQEQTIKSQYLSRAEVDF